MAEVSLTEWNRFLDAFPDAHLLQTGAWGELKSAFGWEVVRLIVEGTGVQLLFRKLPLGLTFGYAPKAPFDPSRSTFGFQQAEFGEHQSRHDKRLWSEVDAVCRKKRAIFLKIEPDASESNEADLDSRQQMPTFGELGLRPSRHSIQPRSTVIVDLRGREADILGRMRPKCRYNIRLAEKKGVTIQHSEDVSSFHRMLRATGMRDGFSVHSADYVRRAFELFHPIGMADLLFAEYLNKPVAALMVFARGRQAWYLYGASSDAERERMPNYLLQWEAMRWARARGCQDYDLWGVPDENESTLEANFQKRHNGLWGVYRFKRGFGGELRRAAQAWDRIYQPLLYAVYRWRAPGQETP
jgi:lipid II:glycine glycyltransferase (peptidoglycan interpeptide bridge formation enzyme)